MCIISVFPKGTKKDTEQVYQWIINGAMSNNHGSGYAFRRNGEERIHLAKAIFDPNKLIEELKACNLTEDDELIVHHRIGTSGTNRDRNTHPFVVSWDFEEMTQVRCVTDKPIVAHNGIFNGYWGLDDTYNDTCHWIKMWLTNPNLLNIIENEYYDFYDGSYARLMDAEGFCRLAFLFPKSGIVMLGNFIEESDGSSHSNSCYKDTRIRNIGGRSEPINENKSIITTNWSETSENYTNTNSEKEIMLAGYRERVIAAGGKDILTIELTDTFYKLTPDNIGFFLYEDSNDNYWYLEDNTKKESDNKSLILLRKYAHSEKDITYIKFEDLKNMVRKVRKPYIPLFKDLRQIYEVYGNKLSKNKRKKIRNKLEETIRNNKNTVNIKGIDYPVFTKALEMYINNYELTTGKKELVV